MKILRNGRHEWILQSGLLVLFFEVVAGQVEGDVRLAGTNGYNGGRVEIYHAGSWGTVCDDYWDIDDAVVTCRQLGFRTAIAAYSEAHFGEGTGNIWLDDVNCRGYETRLEYCYHNGWNVHNCGHYEDAGVECSNASSATTPSWRNVNGDVRLIGGSHPYEGRVEIYYDGEWNTVCDDLWDVVDAFVVCNQLGYEGPAEALSNAYFGSGFTNILLDNVGCSGWESSLLECPSNGLYVHNCHHTEDAGVRCGNGVSATVRLRDGYSERSGRVEIYNDGEWGTICDDFWTFEDALVICRQLGYYGVDSYYSGAHFGEGSGPIMYNIGCTGNELTWEDCHYENWGTAGCSHTEDASVVCSTSAPGAVEAKVRLVDGDLVQSGRVEIYHSGEWGTVCDDNWGMDEAKVVCRQLGYTGVSGYDSDVFFGEGTGLIMLDNVHCDGSEHTLAQCSHSGWYNHDCSHSEDVGVRCETPVMYYPRLVDGYAWYEGRVEVWDGSRWEKVCYESFYSDEASTVCKQIGFSDYKTIFDGEPFGSGDVPSSDVVFDCNSTDDQLRNCHVNTRSYGGYCRSVALRCTQYTSVEGGIIAVISVASASLVVCICVGLLVSYQSSKRTRSRSSPPCNVTFISGTVNPTGPSSSAINQSNDAAPPAYSEVVNNPMYHSQHVEHSLMPHAGMTPAGIYPNRGGFDTVQSVNGHSSSKPGCLYPYPSNTFPVPVQPRLYPDQPSNSTQMQADYLPPLAPQPQQPLQNQGAPQGTN